MHKVSRQLGKKIRVEKARRSKEIFDFLILQEESRACSRAVFE
jgi:hypothetical protein